MYNLLDGNIFVCMDVEVDSFVLVRLLKGILPKDMLDSSFVSTNAALMCSCWPALQIKWFLNFLRRLAHA